VHCILYVIFFSLWYGALPTCLRSVRLRSIFWIKYLRRITFCLSAYGLIVLLNPQQEEADKPVWWKGRACDIGEGLVWLPRRNMSRMPFSMPEVSLLQMWSWMQVSCSAVTFASIYMHFSLYFNEWAWIARSL